MASDQLLDILLDIRSTLSDAFDALDGEEDLDEDTSADIYTALESALDCVKSALDSYTYGQR